MSVAFPMTVDMAKEKWTSIWVLNEVLQESTARKNFIEFFAPFSHF